MYYDSLARKKIFRFLIVIFFHIHFTYIKLFSSYIYDRRLSVQFQINEEKLSS